MKGLDGAKVGVLEQHDANVAAAEKALKEAKEKKDEKAIAEAEKALKEANEKKLNIESDFEIFSAEVAKKERDEVPKEVAKLHAWWVTTGEPNADKDAAPVKEATIHGGQMAMKATALVPLTMFVGYLLLVLYFKAKGGYKQIHIGHGDETTKTEM